jgi:hypothetical protein
MRIIVVMRTTGKVNKKKITEPIFIFTLDPMLPNSQESTNAHFPSKHSQLLVLYNELQSSTGRFHTFPNFGNYHEFSFSLNDGTIPP